MTSPFGVPTGERARATTPIAQALAAIEARLGGAAARRVEVYGAVGALGPALAARLALAQAGDKTRKRPTVVYLVADDELSEARVGDLRFFLPGEPATDDPLVAPMVMHLPAPEISPYAEVQPDRRNLLARMAVLYRLSHGPAPTVLVTSIAALVRRVFPRAAFDRRCDIVSASATINRDATLRSLLAAGYGRASVVEDPGTFAVRGAVIDLFPPVYHYPVRIELFGDEVESIRLFDPATQRTLRQISAVHIHPVRETLRTEGADPRGRLLAAVDRAGLPSSKTRLLLEQVEAGESFFGMEALAPIFHEALDPLTAYLPADALFVVEDPEAVLDQARRVVTKLRESAVTRHAEHRLALDPTDFVLSEEEAHAVLTERAQVELHSVEVERAASDDAPPRLRLNAESNATLRMELQQARTPHDSEESDLGRPLRERITAWMKDGARVGIVASNRTHADRLSALLDSWGMKPRLSKNLGADLPEFFSRASKKSSDSAPAGTLFVLVGSLSHGFRLPGDRLVLIAEDEIFGRHQAREARTIKTPALGDLGEIAEGDVIVHDDHGVGRYRGLKKLQVRGVTQDFLHLEYDGGLVYVPVYRIGLLHRYGAVDGEAVRLDKLGGKTWAEKRRRVSTEARKIAEELLQLYAQRAALSGHAFPAPDAVFRELEETFPFDETPDQAKAIDAVLDDMQAGRPMDRLVCGDVGYGKTEVALRGALLAVLGGKQVAVLAPTTVLAEQHFVTFSERYEGLPVRVAALSRFRSRQEQQKTIADLATGKVDLVVGTHRVLSRDVRFRDLGLVVIDEEQRFGVVHKERLKELRTQVDVLTLTATPIPRTLQMAIGGLREISIIATPPADRLAIRTFVCRWDPDLLREAIEKELARGGQIFFVHNRIEDLAEWMGKIRDLSPPGTRLAMAHGRMGEGELEKVMVDFVDARVDILCSTTIIESGLDIPRANTMIVNHADRFGLAQLYQMRGRIGRSRERAFCYLVVPNEERITPEAKQRLTVLQRFTELGAGFQVATHDLEIRGAGELLGDKQSGAVAAVGFETYARILEEAVAELKGEPIRHERDPEIAVDVPAFLPDDYVPDAGQRLDFYRRLARADSDDDIRATLIELEDRYGPLPDEGRLLGEVMGQKILVRGIAAVTYELGPARFVLSLGPDSPLDPTRVMRLVQAKHSRWKLSPDMRLSYTFDEPEKRDRLSVARAKLTEVAALAAPETRPTSSPGKSAPRSR
ncbi:MAG TPA: transcription-repair coupling factor [Polyangia bacterium]|jgi:transcription-repair coupling factor (superfamily II helicase)